MKISTSISHRCFSESDKKVYFSAVTIQKVWRGYVVRKIIKKWNASATIIQKFVRRWLVRLHLPDYYKAYYYKLGVAYYNKQATKIQALWRGYYSRKITISVKTLLTERREIEEISKEMQEQIRNAFRKIHEDAKNEKCQYLKKILTILFDRHHLLRTKVQEGIFSVHGSRELSCVERILQSFPLTDYMKELQSLLLPAPLITDVQTEKKRFDLNTNTEPKPYQRSLLSQD